MQKVDINDLLNAKEDRKKIIDEFSKNTFLITIKSNFPSIDKTSFYPSFVTNEIAKIIKLKQVQCKKYADGLVYFFTSESNFKTDAINIENTHELGRYVDIDVYFEGRPISRTEFGHESRRCFLCENDAKFCARNKTHEQQHLIDKFVSVVDSYISTSIKNASFNALLKELNIEGKFGLVTPTSQGIHKDMDYELFIKSINVVSDEIAKIPKLIKNNNNWQAYKEWGIQTEYIMRKATNGVNTHKGALFALGVQTIRYLNELFYKNFEDEKYNKGLEQMNLLLEKLDDKHGPEFKGALYWARNKYGLLDELFDELNDIQKLLKLCTIIDDSTVINRVGIERYRRFQSMANSLVANWNHDEYIALNEWSYENRISPGGAADLLSLHFYKNELKINET